MVHICKFLDRNRFQVTILSGATCAEESHWVDEVRRNDICLAFLPELTREIAPLRDLMALVKMINFIRRGKFDIVHTNSSKAGILGRFAAALAGTRAILHTVHGWPYHEYMSGIRKRVYVNLERIAGEFTDRIIAVSELNVKKGLKFGIGRRDKYCIIRSGIDMNNFRKSEIDAERQKGKWKISPSARVVGTVTRLSRQKAPVDFVRMANEILKRNSEVTFLLVGDGPLRQETEDLVRDLGISNKVLLTGFRDDIPELLAMMDVFVLTSLWEGLPRVLPQAMAMGLPVVATCVDGVPEAVQHGRNGFLVQPGDFHSAAEYVLQLLEDKSLAQAMGKEGRQMVYPEFCVREMVSRTEHLYERLITARSST